MFLRTIKLKNYRKFKNETIEFPEGVVGIIGRNGVGKSSIFEAIGWGLYGNVMARSDKQEVKSQNAEEGENCLVELEFDMGGHVYKVIRELKGKNAISNALVYVDGNDEPEATRDRGVNAYIEQLMGMDYATFIKTVYAKQKDLAAFSILGSEERKKMIRRMLNIDKIDIAITQIRKDERGKADFVKGITAGLVDIGELKEQKKKILDNQKKINSNIQSSKTKAAAVSEKKLKIKQEKNIQDDKSKSFNEINKELSRLSQHLLSLEGRLEESHEERQVLEEKQKDLKKIEPKEKEYEGTKIEKENQEKLKIKYEGKIRIEDSVRENKEDIKSRKCEIKDIEGELKEFANIETDSEKVEKSIVDHESRRKAAEREGRKVHAELSKLESKIKDLSLKKQNITKLGHDSKCPTCFRELGNSYLEIVGHFDKEISVYQKKMGDVQKQENDIDEVLKNLDRTIDNLVKNKNIINKKLQKKSRFEQSLEDNKKEVAKVERKISAEQEKLKGLKNIVFNATDYDKLVNDFETLSEVRDSILGLRKEVQRIPRLTKAMELINSEITKCKDKIESQKNKLEKLDFNEKEYDKIKKAYEDINDALRKAQLELRDVQHEMKLSKQKLDNINKNIKQDQENRKKVEEVEVEIQYLEKLEILMKDFRLELTGRILPLLEARASFLFNEVTDGRYPIMNLDEDYEISIVDGDQAYGLSRFSGGEEDLANLCLRLAMSQVIAERSGGADINFIALDEIFGSQDEKRKQNILNSFSRLSSQFRQIFLITHIEDIKEMLPRVLRVEEDILSKNSRVIQE